MTLCKFLTLFNKLKDKFQTDFNFYRLLCVFLILMLLLTLTLILTLNIVQNFGRVSKSVLYKRLLAKKNNCCICRKKLFSFLGGEKKRFFVMDTLIFFKLNLVFFYLKK